MNLSERQLASVYLSMKDAVLQLGFANEIAWQYGTSVDAIREADLLREAAWVILSAGFSAQAVQCVFPAVSAAYLDWDLRAIVDSDPVLCETEALQAIAHRGKVRAITAFCLNVYQIGLVPILEALREDGPDYLERFDFIGPVTSRHLAKNLGLDIAKPDRHLIRLASHLGATQVDAMCSKIADFTGDPVAVVDLVLWRFAVATPRYLERLEQIVSVHTSPSGSARTSPYPGP